MTHLLPPQMLRLFVARAPLEYVTPLREDKNWNAPPENRSASRIARGDVTPLTGVAAFLERARQQAADRGETTEDDANYTHALVTQTEMRREERAKRRTEMKRRMLEECKCNLSDGLDDPKKDTHAIGDPFKTLFLARLPYSTTEQDLRREFDRYGPIERIAIVHDQQGKSRGYAFILFERERDMRTAYSRAEGIRLEARRVLVDVERGRTVKDWKPKRLGGGLGGQSRRAKIKPVVDNCMLVLTDSVARAMPSMRGGRGRGGGGSFRGRGRGGGRDGGMGARGDRGFDRDRGFERDQGYHRDQGYNRDRPSSFATSSHGYGDRPRFVREGQRDAISSNSGPGLSYQDRDNTSTSHGYSRVASHYDDRSPKRARF
ncbi:hypothetical protein MYAM1_001305 [Malassezia yamatoensis]|uniref:U1 small nuclear ribonucleoprotein 70 kDa n=1 Tax=Malassezia yamatoensis TaxID=253288 RepID=A0AAJ6CGU1_9BASI|nr:hypothetical protein MYAM1_001305 [Malassezia yamatoensis]